jgi:hypothetical protein
MRCLGVALAKVRGRGLDWGWIKVSVCQEQTLTDADRHCFEEMSQESYPPDLAIFRGYIPL